MITYEGIGEVGEASAYLIKTTDECRKSWICSASMGAFDHYWRQISDRCSPPFLLFKDLWICEEHRKKGIGSLAMLKVMQEFLGQGAKTAFLRIGTQGDSWNTGKVWRQRMYEKLGWIELVNPSEFEGDVPILYCPLADISFARDIALISLKLQPKTLGL